MKSCRPLSTVEPIQLQLSMEMTDTTLQQGNHVSVTENVSLRLAAQLAAMYR
jgi:hypothetical protein